MLSLMKYSLKYELASLQISQQALPDMQSRMPLIKKGVLSVLGVCIHS